MEKQTTNKKSERGAALIFALLSILVLSILAVAIMSTSQEQVWTSLNYRLTAQARYAAEAGVQETMSWLSSASYTVPTTFTAYNMNTNPVTLTAGGAPVVLSSMSGVTSTYPDSNVVKNFKAATGATVPNESNVSYATTATLLRMNPAGGVGWLPGTGGIEQTWQVTSVATINGIRNATVQVTQTYERAGEPVFQYGLEALGTGCNAINMVGGDSTDSYNSSTGTYASQYNAANGYAGTAGSIATNGGVTLGNSGGKAAQVHGQIASPIPIAAGGIGTACTTTGGNASTGLTDSDHTLPPASGANYLGFSATPKLTAPAPFGCAAPGPTCVPTSPAPLSGTPPNQNVSTSCSSISGCTCTGGCKSGGASTTTDKVYLEGSGSSTTANDYSLAPNQAYGNITINNNDVVHLSAGTYTVNSLTFQDGGNGQVVIDSGPVTFQLVGNCPSGGGCPTESVPNVAVGKTGSGNTTATEVIFGTGYAGMNGCAPSGGKGVLANPGDYSHTTCNGSAKSPLNGIPSNLQIVYGGNYLIRLGGMPNSAVIYEPGGNYYTPGAPVGLFGSVIANIFYDDSGSPFHYDTAEANAVMKLGLFRPVGGFSWSKF